MSVESQFMLSGSALSDRSQMGIPVVNHTRHCPGNNSKAVLLLFVAFVVYLHLVSFLMSLKNCPHLSILKCFVLLVPFCVVLFASISPSITITFDALSTCMMVSLFLMPSCTLPVFFGLASSLDYQFFHPNINAIFIKNDCVCDVRLCYPVKQCLGSIHLHPLAQVVISNSLFDRFVNEVEKLLVSL